MRSAGLKRENGFFKSTATFFNLKRQTIKLFCQTMSFDLLVEIYIKEYRSAS